MKLIQKYFLFLFNLILVASLCFTSRNISFVKAQAQTEASSITFDNLTQVSPDGNYVVYLTALNLGMVGTSIWLDTGNGPDVLLVAGDSIGVDYWVTNPVWSPDSRSIAYLKAIKAEETQYFINYKYEIWLVNRDGSNNHLITNTSLLKPKIGYGGKTDLTWTLGNEIEFFDQSTFPAKKYAVNIDNLDIREISNGNIQGAATVSSSSLNVGLYKQTSSPWAGDRINQSSNCSTIAVDGCTITSVAMVLNYFGYTISNAQATPRTLNNWLSDHSGYSDCWLIWTAIGNIDNTISVDTTNLWSPNLSKLQNKINTGTPVILWYYTSYPNMHFVVATGYNNSSISVNDPIAGNTTLDFNNASGMVVIEGLSIPSTFEKTNPDDNSTITPPATTFQLLQWSDAQIASTDRYQYCIDETDNAQCESNNWMTRNSLYSGPDFTVLAGHTYYWQVRVRDAGIYADNGSWHSFTVQPNFPTVTSIIHANPSPTNASSVNFTVTFSESVTGVDAGDFSLATTGVLGASVSGVSGSGSVYNVTVNTGTGSGTIQLNLVDNDSIINSQNTPLGGVGAGNGNYSGETYIIDKAAPTVVSTVPPVTATTVSINFTVTFSEFVTGVDNPNDFSLTTSGNVTGASITSVSGTAPNNIYTVQVNTGNIGSGTIRLNVVNNGTIKDLALNTLNGVFNNGVLYNKPTFADVPVTDWAWQYTERMYNAQITTGCDGANYCPQTNVTRAEVAVFVERALHGGSYQPPVVPLSFNDTSGHWAQYWIERFKSEGITTGCGGGKYCPDQNVTRAEMSVFILRALHGGSYQPPVVGLTFNDTTGHWAQYWIEQFKTEGITTGCGGGKYCPDQNVTRAEMAVFIVRAFGYPVLP